MQLDNVTIILYDGTGRTGTAAEVMRRVLSEVEPYRAVVVSPAPPQSQDWNSIVVPECSWNGGQMIQAYGMTEYFDTSHMMLIELDGFPIHGKLWNSKWLEYDYIGAPWHPINVEKHFKDCRVGNGGCSLQSRRLRTYLHEQRSIYPVGRPSDQWICQDMRNCRALDRFRFAPVDEAIKFSFEADIPEFPGWDTSKSFAFHGRKIHPKLCPK